MIVQALFLAIIFLVRDGGTASNNVPAVDAMKPVIPSTEPDNLGESDTCWAVTCLFPFAKYYNQILLHNENFEWSVFLYTKYRLALKYFAVSYGTPIYSIKKAFETCAPYNRMSEESCLYFFDLFASKGYAIDLIADYCYVYPDICRNPEKRLYVTFQEDQFLATAENLQFSNCLQDVSKETRKLLTDNLRFANLLTIELPKITDGRNKCQCNQVHSLGNLYRVLDENAVIEQNSAPSQFDDLLISLCISTDRLHDQFLWDESIIETIGANMNALKRTIKDPVELAKQILLNEYLIIPLEQNAHLGWNVIAIVEATKSFHLAPENYKRVISLIADATMYMPNEEEFRSFLRSTRDMFRKSSAQLFSNENPLKTLDDRTKLLSFRERIMQMFRNNGKATVLLIISSTLPDNLYFDDALGFFVDHYQKM